MIRVGVVGACGRMGQIVCRTVVEDPDLALVAAIDRSRVGERIGPLVGHPEINGVNVSDELDSLTDAECEVAVDFTHPDVVRENVRWCVAHAVNLVVGTTGLTEPDLNGFRELLEHEGGESNVIVAPNFALGAVLMQHFSAIAARFLPAAEVIELHHEGKADAPSGTALATVRRILGERQAEYRGPDAESLEGARGGELQGVRVHSVRLPGLVAHQEVIFGGQGQTLTIRHDSMDRSSFMPGVVMAVKAIASRRGLTVGLEQLLDLPPTR
ncbi:MAG TPA: 4-hydroxy-tetrahydrodipicolinate reductase [Actinomycetota bacterium]|nr:4-hydroxy-tetrahydrodipicolinate reductase [Actinomycetota bacterium]